MIVRITQIDGKLPNLALMRLSSWHRSLGDEVHWVKGHAKRLEEPNYDIVYASAIFETSQKAVRLFMQQWPSALIGGQGGDKALKVEDIVPSQFQTVDYSAYPDFTASIGYAMRGCRRKCGFCCVPKTEGAARSASAIGGLWRGPGFPKNIHLLDNDFFGNPMWRSVVRELVDGDFKVCINQGINIRDVQDPKIGGLDDEQAEALAALQYKDDSFARPRLYSAWDMLGDEEVFFRGVDRLERYGIPPQHVMAYMLVGYNKRETWADIMHRYERMVDRGVRPYPMVYGERLLREDPEYWRKLKRFQSWVLRGTHKVSPFESFNASHRATIIDDRQLPLFSEIAD